MKISKTIWVFILAAAFVFGSCDTSKTLRGGAIGAGAGGAIGGLIGSGSDNSGKGAILGAAIGGTAGALIGNYMDKQAEELENVEGAEVERVGEGIKVTFDSGILFGFDSSKLSPEAQINIAKMAETLKEYEDTEILIEGHTDSAGSEDYNLELSEERAATVAKSLKRMGVKNSRIEKMGYGESMPVADNSTEMGREQNRRVEVSIFANEELREAAKNGQLDQNQ